MNATRAGLAGLVALMMGVSAPAAAQQGVLSLADRRLAHGATVNLTGAQFPPGARVALALRGGGRRVALGTATAGPDGTLAQSFTVPEIEPGAWRLEAQPQGGAVTGLDVAVIEPPDAHAAAANPPPSAGGASPGGAMAPMTGAGTHADTGRAHAGAMAPMSGAGMDQQHTEPGPHSHGEADAPAAASWVILGYDWPRLHAALNDFPAALLMVAVLFEIAGLVIKRPSLRAASFWTLLAGTAGTIAAVVAGFMAEDLIDHDDIGHLVMQRHKTLGLITLGVFAALALWRVARRRSERRGEHAAWCVVGAGGVALLIVTAQLGGSLMFDHGMGISSSKLFEVLESRGAMPMRMDSTRADSTSAPAPAPHHHHDAPGTPPHSHATSP